MNENLLKQTLITLIQQTEDVELLHAIKDLLESRTSLYPLSQAQKESVEISRRQIAAGEFWEHDRVMEEMRRRMNDKY